MARPFDVDPDIRRAWTLPGEVYSDPALYARQLERVFARSWQLVPGVELPAEAGDAVPFRLLAGSLDEPLFLVLDEAGTTRCLSNVCTHRGMLLVGSACRGRVLRCPYHGRRFGLNGRFLSMPEFEGATAFPSPADDLPALPLERWGPLAFTALVAPVPFAAWFEPVRERVEGLGLEALRLDAAGSRDYEVRAHWALYCDNYLEGFHIPYVHDTLAAELDYGSYRTETFPWGSLQIGIARDAEATFALPAGHPDHGQSVAAYYFWLFPNLMLNFYPWGLSINVVEPLGVDRTRVRFLFYVADAARRNAGAGADLHRVEMEDEAVVEAVHIGIRSRLYGRGRFSPAREQGVHQFHRLLANSLSEA